MNLSSTTGNNIIDVVGYYGCQNEAYIETSKGYNIVYAENYTGSGGYFDPDEVWSVYTYNTGGHDTYNMYGNINGFSKQSCWT